MTVIAVDRKRNLAICRYYDSLAEATIPVECDPDSLDSVVPQQSLEK